jgi:hypothetical protein
LTWNSAYAGSEMTPVFGITEAGVKHTGIDWRVLPRTVIYDVDLTRSISLQRTGRRCRCGHSDRSPATVFAGPAERGFEG